MFTWQKWLGVPSIILFVLMVSACNSQGPDEAMEHKLPFLKIVESGGCMMAGPNCAEYNLYRNGSFNVKRTETDELAGSGLLDRAQLDSLIAMAEEAGFQDFIDSLGSGECLSCFDGTDVVYHLIVNGEKLELDSTKTGFDYEHPFFEQSAEMRLEMRQAVNFEILHR